MEKERERSESDFPNVPGTDNVMQVPTYPEGNISFTDGVNSSWFDILSGSSGLLLKNGLGIF